MKITERDESGFEAARQRLQQGLAAFVRDFERDSPSGFVSASVYQRPAPAAQDIAVIATNLTAHAGTDHQQFIARRIAGQRVSLHGTSVGEAAQSDRPVLHSASGYRSDHHCLNLKAGADSVVQLVFEDPRMTERAWQATGDRLSNLFSASAMREALASFTHAYGGHLGDFMDMPSSDHRQAFMMFCDVSGYTSIILPHAGEAEAAKFTRALGEHVTHAAAAYGGELVRSEGDGFWIAFPCTDFNEGQRKTFLDNNVMQAARDIVGYYNAFKEGFGIPAFRGSHLKIAISWSDMTATPQDSRYQKGTLDGTAFVNARALASNAPRNRDVILVDKPRMA